MIDIEQIYEDFIASTQKENRKKYDEFKGWYSASSAGQCYKKQWYKIHLDEDDTITDKRVNRLLRLGTIVHKDIEDAIIRYKQFNDITENILSEEQIKLPDLNVVGHCDLAVIHENAGKVFDFKTVHSYKWKMKFGRKPEKNSAVNYKLQVGTYALGIMDKHDVEFMDMSILWYKKDDSMLREEKLDNDYISHAIDYWDDLHNTIKDMTNEDDLVKNISANTPVMDWECRYCIYQDRCK